MKNLPGWRLPERDHPSRGSGRVASRRRHLLISAEPKGRGA